MRPSSKTWYSPNLISSTGSPSDPKTNPKARQTVVFTLSKTVLNLINVNKNVRKLCVLYSFHSF